MQILLIEDDESHAEIFERCVTRGSANSVTIEHVTDLTTGIERCSDRRFDVVVVDLGLPESRGLDTLHTLLESHSDFPVVVLTAADELDLSLEVIRVGAQDYICKADWTPGVIVRSLHHAIERFQLLANLERVNTSLQTFASAAAHDLSAPLRQISFGIEFLLEDHGKDLGAEPRERLNDTQQIVNRLRNLIEALLDFSRFGGRVDQVEPCALGELASAAQENLEQDIEAAGAIVEVGSLPTLEGDPQLLVQVFQNLLSNAIKYCGEEPPRVEVSATEGDKEHVISMRDNGIGIEERHLQEIFTPLRRMAAAQCEGSGIGLASCMRIVQAHGGRIWAESEVGRGSTFHIALPKEHSQITA